MNNLSTFLRLFIGCFTRRPNILLASLVYLLSRDYLLADSCKITSPDADLASADVCDSADIAADASIVDVSQIKFYTWTWSFWSPSGDRIPRMLYELEYGDEVRRKEAFNQTDILYLYVTFHGVGQDATAEWINRTLEGSSMSILTLINVDYSNLVANNTQALRNVEAIANHTAVYLEWFVDSFLDGREMIPAQGGDVAIIFFVGFDMGAIIAGRTGERLTENTNGKMQPLLLTALDPYLADPKDMKTLHPCYRFPELSRNAAKWVQVHHTSTCSHVPTIPTCDESSNATMGSIDFIYNDPSVQPGCSASDVQCSKNRMLDYYIYMVSMDGSEPPIMAVKCSSFADFRNGLCTNCTGGEVCVSPLPDYEYSYTGRYYIRTNAHFPYGRDLNFTIDSAN